MTDNSSHLDPDHDHGEVHRALRRWGQHVRDSTPHTDLPDFSGAHRRPTARLVAPLCAAVIVVTLAVVVAVGSQRADAPSSRRDPATPATPSGASPDSLVVHEGDAVVGQGVVVAIPGRPVRFCAPGAGFGVGGRDDRFTYCSLGVDAVGVRLDRLADRATRTRDGAVYGMARLEGTYRNGTLHVTSQHTPNTERGEELPRQPPCAAPRGGWPRGAKNENLPPIAVTRYQREHPGSIAQFAELRPSNRQVVVFVLTAGDPTPVAAALRPALGKRLCVTRSRWTAWQLSHARHTISGLLPVRRQPGLATPTAGSTDGLGTDAQIQMFIDVPIVDQALATTLDDLPPRLVRINPWLSPT